MASEDSLGDDPLVFFFVFFCFLFSVFILSPSISSVFLKLTQLHTGSHSALWEEFGSGGFCQGARNSSAVAPAQRRVRVVFSM